MIEKEEKILDIPAVAPPAAAKDPAPAKAAEPTLNASNNAPEPKMSKGEKWYNRVVYSWLNYWTNLGISVIAADIATYGKGRPWLDKQIGRVTRAVAATKIVSREVAHRNSKVAVETLTLLTGGYLLLIPLKIAEDHKRSVVHWLNKKFGVSQQAADGRELKADEIYIELEQPHQTWWNVIKRRLLGTALVIATGSAIDHAFADKKQKRVESFDIGNGEPLTYETHLGGKEWSTDKIIGGLNKGANFVTGRTDIGTDPNTLPQRWMKLAALDTIFTKITALTMWFTKGAKKMHMPHEVGDGTVSVSAGEAISEPATTSFVKRIGNSKGAGNLVAKEPADNFATAIQNQKANSSDLTITP